MERFTSTDVLHRIIDQSVRRGLNREQVRSLAWSYWLDLMVLQTKGSLALAFLGSGKRHDSINAWGCERVFSDLASRLEAQSKHVQNILDRAASGGLYLRWKQGKNGEACMNMGGADRGDKLKINGDCSHRLDDDMAFHLVPAPASKGAKGTGGYLMRSKKYARTVQPRPGDEKLILGAKALLMDDTTGLYYVTKAVDVTLGSSWDSKVLAQLPVGEFVQVDQFFHGSSKVGDKWFGMRSDYHEIVRAHIAEPAGWINIMDTDEGVRWAHKVEDVTPDKKGSLLKAITIPERGMCDAFLKGESE